MSPTTGILLLTLAMFPYDHKAKSEVHGHQIDAQWAAHPKHGHKAVKTHGHKTHGHKTHGHKTHKIHGHKAKKLAAPPTAIAAPMPSWDAVLGLPSQQLREPPIVALRGFRGGVLTEQEGQLTSLDDPSFWTAVPYGPLTALVRFTVDEQALADMQLNEDFGFIQLFLDEKPLSNKRFLVNRDEMRLDNDDDPVLPLVNLTYEFSIPCPAPGKHIVQARYVFGGLWSRLSEPLRFEVQPPRQPQIVAVYNAGDVAGPLTKFGVVSITGDQVHLKLANVLASDRVISYLDGERVHAEAIVDGSCCVSIPVQGEVPPGKYALTVRIVPPGGQCELASEPSNEVLIHVFTEENYLLRPARACCQLHFAWDVTENVLPKRSNTNLEPTPLSEDHDRPSRTQSAYPHHDETTQHEGIHHTPTDIHHTLTDFESRIIDVATTPTAVHRGHRRHMPIHFASFQPPTTATQLANAASVHSQQAIGANSTAIKLSESADRDAKRASDYAAEARKQTQHLQGLSESAKHIDNSAADHAELANRHFQNATVWLDHAKANRNLKFGPEHRQAAEDAYGLSQQACRNATHFGKLARAQAIAARDALDRAERAARAVDVEANAVAELANKVRDYKSIAYRLSRIAEESARIAASQAAQGNLATTQVATTIAIQATRRALDAVIAAKTEADSARRRADEASRKLQQATAQIHLALTAKNQAEDNKNNAVDQANLAMKHANDVFESAQASGILVADVIAETQASTADLVESAQRTLQLVMGQVQSSSEAARAAELNAQATENHWKEAQKLHDDAAAYKSKAEAIASGLPDAEATKARSAAAKAHEETAKKSALARVKVREAKEAAETAREQAVHIAHRFVEVEKKVTKLADAQSAIAACAENARGFAQEGKVKAALQCLVKSKQATDRAQAAARSIEDLAQVITQLSGGAAAAKTAAFDASNSAEMCKKVAAASVARATQVVAIEAERLAANLADETARAEEEKAQLRIERALDQDRIARAKSITGPPSPFYFASSAYFPQREFGPNGEVVESDGLVIYEDMKFSFDAEGNYSLLFKAGTPAMPATLRLRLLVQPYRGGPWYTITVPPIRFQPEADKKHRLDYLAKVQDYEAKGHSEILRRCYGQMGQGARIRREGTATFGFGYRLMD